MWRQGLVWLAWLLGSAAVIAQAPGDPLKSPACGEATQALEAAREAASSSAQPAARIEQLRRHAARTCLGAGADHEGGKPPARIARQPERVPAPVVTAPRALRAAPPPASPQPPAAPVHAARPQVLSQCDAGGCWDSNGNRLNRAGPNLMGPQGPCSVQGSFANCP